MPHLLTVPVLGVWRGPCPEVSLCHDVITTPRTIVMGLRNERRGAQLVGDQIRLLRRNDSTTLRLQPRRLGPVGITSFRLRRVGLPTRRPRRPVAACRPAHLRTYATPHPRHSPRAMAAFAPPAGLRGCALLPSAAAAPSRASPALTPLRMSATSAAAADAYMTRTVRAQYKRAAAAPGTYSVQCAEGGVHGEAYETAVRARDAAFRARQASPSAMYRDLYETRRAAIVLAHGCSVEEAKVVEFPAAAAAFVAGTGEAERACSRYAGRDGQGVVDRYMADVVARQYKALAVTGGVYGVACNDGGVGGEAEAARVAAGTTTFKAGHFSAGAKAQAKYNASLRAMALSRGCDYEEKQFAEYPTMAGSMRWGTGVFAAVKGGATQGVSGGVGKKVESLAVRLAGVNGAALWPNSLIRPAIKRKTAPWVESTLKQYRGMSEAALEWGVQAQTNPFKGGGPSEKWTPGWQPKSITAKDY